MIGSVLFDADGVIQTTTSGWRPALEALCPDPADADALLAEIFAVELPCLTGERDFVEELAGVLTCWRIDVPAAEVLEIWTLIDPLPEILAIVDAVRALGLHVGLATNQQEHRARYMLENLDYQSRFDDLFISCRMGVAKPSTDYFRTILTGLSLPAEQVLFIDDHVHNVAAASAVGLQASVYGLASGADGLRSLLAGHHIFIDEAI